MHSEPPLKAISWKDVERLQGQGYRVVTEGDAAKANGDHFLLMRNDELGCVKILCPTFLRGPVTVDTARIRGIGY